MKQTKEHIAGGNCPITIGGNVAYTAAAAAAAIATATITNESTLPTDYQSKEHTLNEAYQFMEQYYTSIKRLHTPAHKNRLREIESEIQTTGSYQLKQTELIFGAKLGWRNAPRCIGRIQWSKLQAS